MILLCITYGFAAIILLVGSILVFRSRTGQQETLGQVLMIIGVILLLIGAAFARDVDGRYAASPLKPWFDSLRSGKGPCCSDADGYTISDVDWETKDGHYRVRIPISNDPADKASMIWIDVPDDAVITEPNRAGRTMVWPIWGYQGPSIRCFMPGSMT